MARKLEDARSQLHEDLPLAVEKLAQSVIALATADAPTDPEHAKEFHSTGKLAVAHLEALLRLADAVAEKVARDDAAHVPTIRDVQRRVRSLIERRRAAEAAPTEPAGIGPAADLGTDPA